MVSSVAAKNGKGYALYEEAMDKGANGVMPLRYWWWDGCIAGGPYMHKPLGWAGVKLASEINKPAHVIVTCKDFGVPTQEDMEAALLSTWRYLLAGVPVWAGCMGGIGRTGTFMACLAKTLEVAERQEALVNYVRENYYDHAVETMGQREFIDTFDVSRLRWQFRWELGKAFFGRPSIEFHPTLGTAQEQRREAFALVRRHPNYRP